jgi:hypothetical protein
MEPGWCGHQHKFLFERVNQFQNEVGILNATHWMYILIIGSNEGQKMHE